MSYNQANMYDVDQHVAEIYDQQENYTDDVQFLRRLLGQRGPLRILEPFCGTGRILIPLALDGHEVVGMDQAKGMLERARVKSHSLPREVQRRITLAVADVVAAPWPGGFDLVVLGANCFYELATPQEQEACIRAAAGALRPGGYLYVDNNHMEGDLDESWRQPGIRRGFPTGTCADGSRVESSRETIWYDAARRLARFRRRTVVTQPDGNTIEQECVQQKHPVSQGEVQAWLEAHGFAVEGLYGDRTGAPYTETAGRAIFWARWGRRCRPSGG